MEEDGKKIEDGKEGSILGMNLQSFPIDHVFFW